MTRAVLGEDGEEGRLSGGCGASRLRYRLKKPSGGQNYAQSYHVESPLVGFCFMTLNLHQPIHRKWPHQAAKSLTDNPPRVCVPDHPKVLIGRSVASSYSRRRNLALPGSTRKFSVQRTNARTVKAPSTPPAFISLLFFYHKP